ncbi:MAG: hypothetical protein PHQ96_05700 [Candidatus Omnitrophica bacterium]|nr:hypothetical protein [Candidatus Omnitrophota bacterium]
MGRVQMLLFEPARAMFFQLGRIGLKALLAAILLIIGLVLSKMLKTVVTRVLKTLKVDLLADRIELSEVLAKGGIKYSLSELIGTICYWLGILISFVVAVNAIGLTIAADLLNRVVLYIPNIIAAIFILILGILGATLLGNSTKTAAANAGVAQANLLGNVVKITIVIFTAIMTLEQLLINTRILELVLSIALATMGLATAIAFGLGCKDIAAQQLDEWIRKLKK